MSETSAQALASIDAASIREQVWGHIRKHGLGGRTCDETEVDLGLRHQTASARITELKKEKRVFQRGRRATRSGRQADVWVAV